MVKLDKYGLWFGFLHLLFFIIFLLYVLALNGRDGQAHMLWIVWTFIDMPISFIFFFSEEIGIKSIYFLYFIHGVLGTIWWYFIPAIIFKFQLKK